MTSALIISDSKNFSEILSKSLEEKIKLINTYSYEDFSSEINSSPTYVFLINLTRSHVSQNLSEKIINFLTSGLHKSIVITSFPESPFFDISNNRKTNSRTLYIQYAFGKSIIPHSENSFSRFLQDLKNNSKLKVASDQRFSPVHEDSIIKISKKCLFSAGTRNESYLLKSSASLTAKNIADLLNTKPAFSETPQSEITVSLPQVPHFSPPDPSPEIVHVFDQLQPEDLSVVQKVTPDAEVLKTTLLTELNPSIKKVSPVETKNKKRSFLKKIVSLALLTILLYFSSIASLAFTAKALIAHSMRQAKNFNFSQSKYFSSASVFLMSAAATQSKPLSALNLLPLDNIITDLSRAKEIAKNLNDSIILLDLITNSSNKITSSALTSAAKEITANELEEFSALVKDLNQKVSEIYLISNESNLIPQPIRTELGQVKSTLSQANYMLSSLPAILGVDQKRQYLVLFQNNSELRATGGFIGSVGFLTVEKGRLLDFEVFDVYELDGQLKGHVEPPLALKTHLGEAGWYLRDSNWDPDFPASAKQAMWFVEKEIGRSVDGVIGVNLNLAKAMLKITGPLNIRDFSETVNHDNLYERAQYHSESAFFPGSKGKKDFLTGLSQALFNEMSNLDETKQRQLILSLVDSLSKKDVLLYIPFADPVFQNSSWTGALSKNECPNPSCVVDSLMVVDSNIGVNKSNYLTTREINVKVSITETEIDHELTVSYKNSSQTDSWPFGPYKNYLRFYLPSKSEVNSLSTSFLGPVTTFDQSESHNRKVVGTLIEVPPSQSREVTVKYSIPISTPLETYHFYLEKQSGSADNLSLEMLSHNQFRAIASSVPELSLTPAAPIRYNMPLLQDLALSLVF